ncbi:MAG: hypothetical protein IT443_11155 [Phycisphaeraceae bacterium]|nr:hypothetical protein [Phycisphaeraceae bacterium]
MQEDIDQILIPRQAIAKRIDQLAKVIANDLQFTPAPGSDLGNEPRASASGASSPAPATPEITIIPILTGSIIFVADLIRRLPLRLRIRLVSVSSYAGPTTSSRGARLQQDLTNLPPSLAGSFVLLIDDILDSGQTLTLASQLIGARQPAQLRTCVLLRKNRPQAMAFPVDYVCFDIPDQFVVGYGLDYNGYYRNLPDIVTLKPALLQASAEHA